MPVEPAFITHSSFKHIQGVPARGVGVPIFKLRVLDSLIDRLLALRERLPGARDLARLPEDQLEGLIASLEQRLHAQVLQSKPPFGGLFPETGMLVDLAA